MFVVSHPGGADAARTAGLETLQRVPPIRKVREWMGHPANQHTLPNFGANISMSGAAYYVIIAP